MQADDDSDTKELPIRKSKSPVKKEPIVSKGKH